MKFNSRILFLSSALLLLFLPEDVSAQKLPHSFARPDQVAIRHLYLDLKVDFEAQKLTGSAALTLNRKTDASKLYLDTNDLDITEVTTPDGSQLKWKQGQRFPKLGQPLIIDLPTSGNQVIISYSSRPSAEAVQWLQPEQTTDKKHPFLFTQSQAILARTWVPCQDTPAVRMTYAAKIQVPSDLLAVMSVSNPQERNETGIYEFEMKQPIPSYLLALAVGDLKFERLGPRSGVYAERSVLKKAAWELFDTERMIAAAEDSIHALNSRCETLVRVGQAIMNSQTRFLALGPECIEPITLAQVAEKANVPVTDVRRVIEDKSIKTPHGVLNLRSFFVGGTNTDVGEK